MTQIIKKYDELLRLMSEFVAGGGRYKDFVRTMESSFAACGLDDEEEFGALQYALAMYGAGDPGKDAEALISACRGAIKMLESRE
jgi:hypothetical protein